MKKKIMWELFLLNNIQQQRNCIENVLNYNIARYKRNVIWINDLIYRDINVA